MASSESLAARHSPSNLDDCSVNTENRSVVLENDSVVLKNDSVIVSGTNADDLGDHRPGIQAGSLAGVKTPLADLGIGKADVRELAAYFGLSNHDLPASPCLASRIAYGVAVTPDRLAQIERGEDWLREKQFTDCRVRLHADDLVRVEVPKAEIKRLLDDDLADEMTRHSHCARFSSRYS